MNCERPQLNAHEWVPLPINSIIVEPDRRLSEAHIARLQDSYARLGGQLLLQPVLVDARFRLIDGAHRLEAARRSGWSRIAALVFTGVEERSWPLIELEANRVRKTPTPLELEAVWRSHYEPEFRARARARRLSALRRKTSGLVLRNTENEEEGVQGALSAAKAAKQTTGLSIETLNKISAIRAMAEDRDIAADLRTSAVRSLQRLSRPGTSVDALYRSLVEGSRGPDPKNEEVARLERRLDRMLEESSLLAERLQGSLGTELGSAIRASPSAREQLRAVRVSLAQALAATVSIECRIESDRVAALRRLGTEVSRLLSKTSVDQLGIEKP